MSNKWTEQELKTMRKIDLELAKLVSEYMGGPWHREKLFIPSKDNIEGMKATISKKKAEVNCLSDDFWRQHFIGVLESLEFTIECNTKMPYEYITRISSGFDSLTGNVDPALRPEHCKILSQQLAAVPAVLEALEKLLEDGTDLARSQVADLLPPIFGNIARTVRFIEAYADSEGLKRDAEKNGTLATSAARRIESLVQSLPLASLEVVDIPFEFSLEKGMQASLDYVLSWYEDDVQYRRDEFFKAAREIDPDRDAYDLLNNGSPGYDSVENLFDDMRRMLKDLRQSALNFIDIPEGDMCGVGLIPETWRMVCPTFMQMGKAVCINPDNLSAFRRGGVEETLAHEVYPGHYAAQVKSAQFDLPNTFNLGLFMSRCHQEGIAHRSEFLMIPYYTDPIARLEAARRGWYCSTRVKVEVDLYYNKRPVQEVIDNYITNLNCTEYSAQGQTRAHMMRPADGVSYYTGMRYIEELYKRSNLDMKEFTDETFNYGRISLKTMRNIFGLSPEKREQLKNFKPLAK